MNVLLGRVALLLEEERLHGVFQQDSATAHTAHPSLVALRDVFGDRFFSRGLWQPRSLDVTPCYFICGEV
jgi:hypothetical protein